MSLKKKFQALQRKWPTRKLELEVRMTVSGGGEIMQRSTRLMRLGAMRDEAESAKEALAAAMAVMVDVLPNNEEVDDGDA